LSLQILLPRYALQCKHGDRMSSVYPRRWWIRTTSTLHVYRLEILETTIACRRLAYNTFALEGHPPTPGATWENLRTGETRGGVAKSAVLEHKSGNISSVTRKGYQANGGPGSHQRSLSAKMVTPRTRTWFYWEYVGAKLQGWGMAFQQRRFASYQPKAARSWQGLSAGDSLPSSGRCPRRTD